MRIVPKLFHSVDFVARKTYSICFCKQKIKQFTLYKVTTKSQSILLWSRDVLPFYYYFPLTDYHSKKIHLKIKQKKQEKKPSKG